MNFGESVRSILGLPATAESLDHDDVRRDRTVAQTLSFPETESTPAFTALVRYNRARIRPSEARKIFRRLVLVRTSSPRTFETTRLPRSMSVDVFIPGDRRAQWVVALAANDNEVLSTRRPAWPSTFDLARRAGTLVRAL